MKKKSTKRKKRKRGRSVTSGDKPKRSVSHDRKVAYHEAGHVVAQLAMGLPVNLVTIRPSRNYNGKVTGGTHPERSRFLLGCGDPWEQPTALMRCFAEIVTLLAASQ
jgi:hypothetical protein